MLETSIEALFFCECIESIILLEERRLPSLLYTRVLELPSDLMAPCSLVNLIVSSARLHILPCSYFLSTTLTFLCALDVPGAVPGFTEKLSFCAVTLGLPCYYERTSSFAFKLPRVLSWRNCVQGVVKSIVVLVLGDVGLILEEPLSCPE